MTQWWIVFTNPNAQGSNWLTGAGANKYGHVVSTASGQPSHQGIYAIFGPYKDKTWADWVLANNAFKQETPVWSAPGFTTANPGVSTAVTGGLTSLLTQSNLWVRIAEGALGLLLIAIGIAKMTSAVPIATKIAGKVA